MRIKATLLILLGLLACCQAQLKVTIQFPSAAPRQVFVAGESPKSPPSAATKSGGQSLEFNIPAFGGTDRIYVWDQTSNNIASKGIKEITNGTWVVADKDYNLVGTITVHVEHKGQPVQAAKVSLVAKGKSDEKLLDPTLKGDVQFFAYPLGDLHVKVAYNTTDKKEGSSEQIFPIAIKRDKLEPVFSVSVADDVATVSESPTSAPAAGQAVPQNGQQPKGAGAAEESSSIGKLVIMLLALIAIAGVSYWVYHMAKNKPKEFEQALQKIGVQIPTQQDPGAGAPIPVAPLPPAAPAPKIMLDDAEPVPLGAPSAFSAMPVAPTGEPALFSESGVRTLIPDGETTVGREDGLGLSLAGESTVSRRHASLTRSDGSVVLKDLGSTNGTFVNGTRLQGEATLKPGDQVQFGSVRFRYEG